MVAPLKFSRNIILLLAVFVLISGILFYLILRLNGDRNISTASYNAPSNSVSQSPDASIYGTFKGISGKEISIEVNGEVRIFTAPEELFYLCAGANSGQYDEIKQTNADQIDSSLIVNLDKLKNVLSTGESVHVFIYRYSDTVTYVKGIVSLKCSNDVE